MIKYERLSTPSEIKEWAEGHGAQPAELPLADGSAELKFKVDGESKGRDLDWDEFLERFRLEGLALLVEPSTSSSHYHKIVEGAAAKDAVKVGHNQATIKKHAQTKDFRAH